VFSASSFCVANRYALVHSVFTLSVPHCSTSCFPAIFVLPAVWSFSSYLSKFVIISDCSRPQAIILCNVIISVTGCRQLRPSYCHSTVCLSKVTPQQAWTGSRGSGSVKAPDFLDVRHYMGGRSSAIRTGCLYPRRKPWYSFSEAESTPGHMVQLVGATEKKSPVTPPGLFFNASLLVLLSYIKCVKKKCTHQV